MRENYPKKQQKRLQQKIKILISNPQFQKNILTLRKKWNIPKEDFSSPKDVEKWYRNLLKSTDEYFDIEWPKFRGKLLELKKQGKIKKAEKKQKKFNEKAPLNEFNDDIHKLISRHKISPKWDNFLRQYLLFNSAKNINISLSVRIQTIWDEKTKTKQISLLIDENTTIEDIKTIWSTVNFFQSTLSYRKRKKFQPIKNRIFKRDKRAYDLKQSNKTLKQIAEIMSKEFNKEYMWYEVTSFIKRHKGKLGIN